MIPAQGSNSSPMEMKRMSHIAPTIVTAVISAAALLPALTGCVKVEQREPSVSETAIAYSVVQTLTKAAGEYDHSVPFVSYGWHLEEGKTWAANRLDDPINPLIPYIDGAEISYDAAGSMVQGISYPADSWHDFYNLHYWPGSGSLTFVSYSPSNIATATADSGNPSDNSPYITVDNIYGVVLHNWNITRPECSGVDFLVSNVAADLKANALTYGRNGVPTAFRHKLAKVSVLANTDEPKEGAEPVVFTIKEIVLRNVYCQGDFSQPIWVSASLADMRDITLYSNESGFVINEDLTLIGNEMFMIPQSLIDRNFSDDVNDEVQISIRYSRSDDDGGDRYFDCLLSTEAHSVVWEMGKDIKYLVTFGQSERPIDFDPDVDDWTDFIDNDVIIGN